jgi:phenylpropionate dioxygenase-like ring-hydroxylating dioxygenase large terminal subunit
LFVDNGLDIVHVGSLHHRYLRDLSHRGAELVAMQDPGGHSAGLAGGHGYAEYSAPWGRVSAQWNPVFGAEAKPVIDAARAELQRLHGDRGTRIADLSRNLLVFPNLVLNDLAVLTLRTYEPLSVDEVEVRAQLLAPVGESKAQRALRLRVFLDLLGPAGFGHADDLAVLESCQRGMGEFDPGWSDYSRGLGRARHRASDEAPMRGFWREWAARMTR